MIATTGCSAWHGVVGLVITAADSTRWGGPTLNGQPAGSMGVMPVDLERHAGSGQASAGQVSVSGSAEGSTVLVRPDRETSVGLSLLSLGVAGFALADEHFGTAIGPLLPPDREP